jgi:predicted Zn-dependent protease
MNKGLLALGALASGMLGGCGTLKGADAAFMNLMGPSTQSQVVGRYVDTVDVRQHYKLDPQRVSAQRLSYDGLAVPAGEIRQHNVVSIAPLQSYLQGIVLRLGKGWPGDLPPLQIKVIDSYGFGPSADPFGNLFVPLGMLDNVQSEDEIAAMLGHEMSHVLLHHHDRRAAFQEQNAMMTNVATTVVFATLVANTGIDRSAGKMKFISKDPLATQKKVGNTVLYTALVNSFSENIWSTAWGRSQEDQADLLGADLMIKAGYAPRAASHSLQRLNDFQGKQKSLLGSFATARKEAMQDSLQKLQVDRLVKEVEVTLNQGLATGITAAGQYFQRSHMSPLDRDTELRQYLQREYNAQRRAQVNTNSWQQLRSSTTVTAAMQAYKDAYSATVALEKKQLREAQLFSDRALASAVRDQPGIRRAAFSVDMAQGRTREALKDLQAIQDWSLASPELYDLMIAHHLANNDPRAALAMIDKAERTLGSEELFITEKLAANKLLNNDSQVKAVLRKCEQYPARKEGCKKLAPVAAA